MRPHETFREPYRKFFHCEVVRSPLCHEVDIDDILGTCCVLDLPTYCMVHRHTHTDIQADRHTETCRQIHMD